jgi:hypothetical protein
MHKRFLQGNNREKENVFYHKIKAIRWIIDHVKGGVKRYLL